MTHYLSVFNLVGHMTLRQHHPAMPTPAEAETAGNTLGVDVDQQLLNDSAGGDNFTKVSLPKVNRSDTCPDASVGIERPNPCTAAEAMTDGFGLWCGSCLVILNCCTLFIPQQQTKLKSQEATSSY
jgi:hypothetical protein